MDNMWYREYTHVPSGTNKVQGLEFYASLKFLQTLDKFGVFYNELISVWLSRFKN